MEIEINVNPDQLASDEGCSSRFSARDRIKYENVSSLLPDCQSDGHLTALIGLALMNVVKNLLEKFIKAIRKTLQISMIY